MIPSLIEDYFRCPSGKVDYDVVSPLSSDAGYFKLGEAILAYGRSSCGFRAKRADRPVYDLSDDIRIERERLKLPFDPSEVIENLRGERYMHGAPHAGTSSGAQLLHKLYYVARPVLSLSVRKHLQKVHLRDWREISFPNWPVDFTVDRLVREVLALSLRASGQESMPFIWFWPDGANACSIMTHDVEADSGRRFCSQLMDIDDNFRIPASFQIVPESRYEVTTDFLMSIKARGFEVNVQDLNHDGRLFQNRDEFLRRTRKINAYARKFEAVGFRSAILYRNQEWYDAFEFEYDMTVPNVAHLDPQRGGCCTVMPYFVGNILELPVTTTQDHSLFNILNDYSLDLWKQQVHSILEQHGLISFIVHPDYILSSRAQTAYASLLQLLSELRSSKALWIALPKEVNRWWRQRSRMKLEWSRGRWVISGEGSERAQIAFARLEDNQVLYRLPEQSFTSA